MSEHNPYQFIVDASHQKKSPVPNFGASKQSRLFIVLGGALVLLILGIIFASFLSNASKAGQDEILKATQQQTELVRISEIGLKLAKGSSAKNLATSVSVSLKSDQATLLATLKSNDIKVSDKQLALGKNSKTDALLTSAEQSNKFDEVFIQTIQTQLVDYQKTLKSAFDKSDSKKVQDALDTQYKTAGLLATARQ